MTARLLQNGKQVFLDANGDPLAAGEVSFFEPGTTIPKDTWQDKDKTTLNPNPVLLDAAGRATIWGSGLYRQVVKDSEGNTAWDQIVGMLDPDKLYWAGVAGGTANALELALKHGAELELVDGAIEGGTTIAFTAGLTNTAAMTAKVTWTGGESLVYNLLKNSKVGPVAMGAGGVIQSNIYLIVFDDSGAGGFISLAGVFELPDGNLVDDILIWDGEAWIPSQRFKELEDLVATIVGLPDGNTVGDILVWNGTAWLPQQPADAGVGLEGAWAVEKSSTFGGGVIDKDVADLELVGLAGASEIMVVGENLISSADLNVEVSVDNGVNWFGPFNNGYAAENPFPNGGGIPFAHQGAGGFGTGSDRGYAHIFGNASPAHKAALSFIDFTGFGLQGVMFIGSTAAINAVRVQPDNSAVQGFNLTGTIRFLAKTGSA